MDQSKSDSTNQQQNVHLHMHQVVCGCHGNLYPTPAYYQTVSYRTPPPPMVTYSPQQIARPYLQHYQYTQYNQYSVPVPQVAAAGAATVFASNNQTDILFGTPTRSERRERLEVHEELLEAEKPSEASGYDYGHVSPPPTKDLLTATSEENMTDNFVKFLERSCITAEQIAHRNRNRPCFRNIQNLCVRTRSEILKPCTTVSNIHSQGIPWATKDFIYAFVRLTNCWHILRGYWENRDGTAIGKITKELTPEFRDCYTRWEKETVELAAQLTKVFYNLDTNINNPMHTGSVHAANNLIPSQVNLIKSPDFSKSTIETNTVSPLTTAIPNVIPSKRGVLHLSLEQSTITETADQGNQTCAGDFYKGDVVANQGESLGIVNNSDGSDDANGCGPGGGPPIVYMKPGSYNVPKRTVANNTESSIGNVATAVGSPRTIEFLETAQNVNKVMEANDRYWNGNSYKKKAPKEDDSSQFNVQSWIFSSRFSDYTDNLSTRSTSPPPNNTSKNSYFMNQTNNISYGDLSDRIGERCQQTQNYTVLQRDKTFLQRPLNGFSSKIDVTSCSFRNSKSGFDNKRSQIIHSFEDKICGILNDTVIDVLEKIVIELKATEFAEYIAQIKLEENLPSSDLDWILNKLKCRQYKYINEVVRDLYYVVNLTSGYYGKFLDLDPQIDIFIQRIQNMLETRLNHFDVNGTREEFGPLKLKVSKYEGDGDHLN